MSGSVQRWAGCRSPVSPLLLAFALLAVSSRGSAQRSQYLQYECNPSQRECSRRMFNIRGAHPACRRAARALAARTPRARIAGAAQAI